MNIGPVVGFCACMIVVVILGWLVVEAVLDFVKPGRMLGTSSPKDISFHRQMTVLVLFGSLGLIWAILKHLVIPLSRQL